MKKFVLTIMLLAIFAAPALAQIEDVGLFADNQGLSCEMTDLVDGAVKRIYIFHRNSNGSSASEFKVDHSSTTLSFISSTVPSTMLSIGDTDNGISISYNECKTGTFLICTILFDAFGTTPACSHVFIVEDPTSVPPSKKYLDCPGFEHPIVGGQAIVNVNVSCPCNVATTPTTWGTIKALYR